MQNKTENETKARKQAVSIALVYFAKVSAWIIIPALFIIVARFVFAKFASHTYIVLAFAVVGVCISFYGIYKESTELIDRHDI